MAKEKDFAELGKEKYEALLKEIGVKKCEIAGLENELKPLKAYLQTIGVLEVKKRGRKPRGEKQEG